MYIEFLQVKIENNGKGEIRIQQDGGADGYDEIFLSVRQAPAFIEALKAVLDDEVGRHGEGA